MKPRHLILLFVLLAVAGFDYLHMHKRHETRDAASSQPAPVLVNGVPDAHAPAPQVALAWSAYERVAALRDASANDFAPALSSFETAKAQVPPAQGTYDAQDLDTCRMWLLQYRKGDAMKSMASHHIDDCAKLHRDVAQ